MSAVTRNATDKVKAIELIDSEILARLIDGVEVGEDYSILIMPDHPTPVSLRTHTSDPVPFVLYRSDKKVITLLNITLKNRP